MRSAESVLAAFKEKSPWSCGTVACPPPATATRAPGPPKETNWWRRPAERTCGGLGRDKRKVRERGAREGGECLCGMQKRGGAERGARVARQQRVGAELEVELPEALLPGLEDARRGDDATPPERPHLPHGVGQAVHLEEVEGHLVEPGDGEGGADLGGGAAEHADGRAGRRRQLLRGLVPAGAGRGEEEGELRLRREARVPPARRGRETKRRSVSCPKRPPGGRCGNQSGGWGTPKRTRGRGAGR